MCAKGNRKGVFATTDYRTIEISDPMEEISDLFGRISLPEGRKSFCSAFVVFLRTSEGRKSYCSALKSSYVRERIGNLFVVPECSVKRGQRQALEKDFHSSHVRRNTSRHYKKISDPLTYVGTLQRHYKKISDPLEEISDQKGRKSLPYGRKFQLFGNL